MPLFDRYLIVDWSAANTPRRGKDSIWLALFDGVSLTSLENIATRSAAMERIRSVLFDTLANGKRLLCGFDFAFGYPAGMSDRITGGDDWRSLWERFHLLLKDEPDNRSNSFELAAQINREVFDQENAGGPYWGHPHQHVQRYEGLSPTRNAPVFDQVPEFRRVEGIAKGAKSVWQLAYNGAVGRQAMLGIARLQTLRLAPELADHLAIWPFETGFAEDLEKPLILCEVYPSLFPVDPDLHRIKDAAQVASVAERFARLDEKSALHELLDAPAFLKGKDRKVVEAEEGWIVGAGHDLEPPEPLKVPDSLTYVRDPQQIYRQSFAEIQKLDALSALSADIKDVAVRVVHACGMPDIIDDLRFSDGAVAAGRSALAENVPILCDVEMVRAGITQRLLPNAAELETMIARAETIRYAKAHGMTRAAAQIDLWGDRINGAVLVIGNAPTALFRLLEHVDAGGAKPALVLAFPVGFVGAAESKAELVGNPRGIPFVTLLGKRGGSAMACAAMNAVAAGLST